MAGVPSRRILVLRSGGEALPAGDGPGGGVDVLVTHEIVPSPDGISFSLSYEPAGACLVISSKTTVQVLVGAGAASIFSAPFASRLAAGALTAAAMRSAGAPDVEVPSRPGAAGIVEMIRNNGAAGRFLWPRGSDADTAPFETLRAAGADLEDPVVYVKQARPKLDAEILKAFFAGTYTGIAVASLAALDVFQAAVRAAGQETRVPVRWGVIGPSTAWAFEERGLPRPLVPARPRLSDLIALLQES